VLRDRELAIEAMKRKIEARMKGQGVPAQEGIAQRLAVSIVDKTAASPIVSPIAQSPETPRETALVLSETSVPQAAASDDRRDDNPDLRKPSANSVKQNDVNPADNAITNDLSTLVEPTPLKLDAQPELQPQDDDHMEDDEEDQLLAELEAERLAEEAARKKRRDLEDRLASARGKKTQRPASAMLEREGQGQGESVVAVQDSTSSLLE
jgi:hypothetical protein